MPRHRNRIKQECNVQIRREKLPPRITTGEKSANNERKSADNLRKKNLRIMTRRAVNKEKNQRSY
jgi:hypothetical protein